jgi:hypothetical protein
MEKIKRIEDYNQVICLVSNEMILTLDVDKAPDPAVYRVTRIKCKKLGKLYETTAGKRIKFDKLMKLSTPYFEAVPFFEVYCEEGDVEAAVELLKQRLTAMVEKWQYYFAHVALKLDNEPKIVVRDEL